MQSGLAKDHFREVSALFLRRKILRGAAWCHDLTTKEEIDIMKTERDKRWYRLAHLEEIKHNLRDGLVVYVTSGLFSI